VDAFDAGVVARVPAGGRVLCGLGASGRSAASSMRLGWLSSGLPSLPSLRSRPDLLPGWHARRRARCAAPAVETGTLAEALCAAEDLCSHTQMATAPERN